MPNLPQSTINKTLTNLQTMNCPQKRYKEYGERNRYKE